MHFVSCRHRTSGRTDLMNFATRSMRRRTELMFQVVREKRIGRMYQGESASARPAFRHGRACPGHPRLSCLLEAKTWMPGTSPGMTTYRCRRQASARRHRIFGEVDLEQAGIESLGGIEIIHRDRGVIALRVGHRPLLELAVL